MAYEITDNSQKVEKNDLETCEEGVSVCTLVTGEVHFNRDGFILITDRRGSSIVYSNRDIICKLIALVGCESDLCCVFLAVLENNVCSGRIEDSACVLIVPGESRYRKAIAAC